MLDLKKKVVRIGDRELYKSPILLLKQKQIFMPVGKVASISIRNSLRGEGTFITKDKIPLVYSNFEIIAVVRNPFDRLVSAYTYFKNSAPKYKLGLTLKSFEEFIWNIYDSPDDVTDCHVRSQLALLSHQNKLLPNRLIPFEHLDAIAQVLPIDKLIWYERTRTQHRPWEEYYNSELTQLVEKRFAGDFELYNTCVEEERNAERSKETG